MQSIDRFVSFRFSSGNINPLRDDGFLNDFRKSKLPGGGSSGPMNESEYSKAFAAYIDRIFAAQAIGEIHPLVKWSYQLNDLLITCVFNERVCHRNLTLLFHPNYGNCYTFDHKSHVRREKGSTRHDWSVDNVLGDHNYKLYMELFLHQQEYNQYFDERAAFRFFIHRKHEVPMLSETSLFLGPDRYTKLSFSQRMLSFTQRCRTNLTENMKRIFSTQQVRYTQALCMKLCEQYFLEKRCGCILPTLFVFYQFYSNRYGQTFNETPVCSIDDECIQNLSSFSKTMKRRKTKTLFFSRSFLLDSREFCSECLPECEIIQYRVQSSYAVFPNVNSIEKVWHRVQNHFRHDRNVTDYLNKPEGTAFAGNRGLKGNILAVEISASPDVTEVLTETPVYTWVDLISSIGGQTGWQMFDIMYSTIKISFLFLGLWIGLSMINIVEILELIYLLLVHCFRRLMNR